LSGYAQQYLPLKFPHLSNEGDEVYVIIRNPRIVPPDELRPKGVTVGSDGEVSDEDAAMTSMYIVFSRLIVGWHVYDASVPESGTEQVMLTDDGQMITPDQVLLSWPPTPDKVAALPIEIINAITEAIGEATNPR
jgi:hypothetical protein